MKLKPRLDEILVERGYFSTLHDAQVAVLAGEVIVGEHRETSAGKRLRPDVEIRLKNQSRFVSRGGEKLAGALAAFQLDVAGKCAADLGCSTGGFTHCLLQAGAASVCAVDVGYGQFSWALRQDPRVALFERTNVRGIDVEAVGGPFELVVGDLSFVSLASLMPDISRLMAPGGQLAILVKPQFELDSSQVGEGGIVRNRDAHAQALQSACDAACAQGLQPLAVACSPIKGPKGNIEFLLHAAKPAEGCPAQPSLVDAAAVEAVVEGAHEALAR